MNPAQRLRKNARRAERILWQHLRNRTLSGHKFRRQHPMGKYILDFYCPEVRLDVELDGSGHAYGMRQQQDEARAQFLAQAGIRTRRFWNDEVRENLDGVLQAIWYAIEEQGGENPSP